jgi:hypothetical protein
LKIRSCIEGEPLNINSAQMAQCVCNFTELYIFECRLDMFRQTYNCFFFREISRNLSVYYNDI